MGQLAGVIQVGPRQSQVSQEAEGELIHTEKVCDLRGRDRSDSDTSHGTETATRRWKRQECIRREALEGAWP